MSEEWDFWKDTYNQCLLCGRWIKKPKEYCDEICERAYRLKEKIPELKNTYFRHLNKNRVIMIFNVAKMLENGWTREQILENLTFWFDRKTVNQYLDIAEKVRLVEAEQRAEKE